MVRDRFYTNLLSKCCHGVLEVEEEARVYSPVIMQHLAFWLKACVYVTRFAFLKSFPIP